MKRKVFANIVKNVGILLSQIPKVLLRPSNHKFSSYQAPYNRYHNKEDNNADLRAGGYDEAEKQNLAPASSASRHGSREAKLYDGYHHRGFQENRDGNEPTIVARPKSYESYNSNARRRENPDRYPENKETDKSIDENCDSKESEDNGGNAIHKAENNKEAYIEDRGNIETRNADDKDHNTKFNRDADNPKKYTLSKIPKSSQIYPNTREANSPTEASGDVMPKDEESGVQFREDESAQVERQKTVREETAKVPKRHEHSMIKRLCSVPDRKETQDKNSFSAEESRNPDKKNGVKEKKKYKRLEIAKVNFGENGSNEGHHGNFNKNERCGCLVYSNCLRKEHDGSELDVNSQKMELIRHLKDLTKAQYQTLIEILDPEDLQVLKEIEKEDIPEVSKRDVSKKRHEVSKLINKCDKTKIEDNTGSTYGLTIISRNKDSTESLVIDESENLKKDYPDKKRSREIRGGDKRTEIRHYKRAAQFEPKVVSATEKYIEEDQNNVMEEKYEILVPKQKNAIKDNMEAEFPAKFKDDPNISNPNTSQKTSISTSHLHNKSSVGNRNSEENFHRISKRCFSDRNKKNPLEDDSPLSANRLQREYKSRKIKYNTKWDRNFSIRPTYNRDYRNDHVRDLEESFAGPSRNSRYWEKDDDDDLQPLVRVKRRPVDRVGSRRHAAGIQPEGGVAYVPQGADEDDDVVENREFQEGGFYDNNDNLVKQGYEPHRYEGSPEYMARKIVAELNSDPNAYRSLSSESRYKNRDFSKTDYIDWNSNIREFPDDGKFLRRDSETGISNTQYDGIDGNLMQTYPDFHRNRRNAPSSETFKVKSEDTTMKGIDTSQTQKNLIESEKQKPRSFTIGKIKKELV